MEKFTPTQQDLLNLIITLTASITLCGVLAELRPNEIAKYTAIKEKALVDREKYRNMLIGQTE